MGVYPRLVKPNEPVAKKRFGQHFLRDTGIIDRIVRWIEPAPGDVFLEIGAGDGALTSRLAPKVSQLLAVEIDHDRIPLLEQNLQPYSSVSIIQGDILQLDIAELAADRAPGRKIRIVGNLPYNIGTAVIEKLLHGGFPARDMFFMVQLEVAQRITAAPGSHEYGYLSVDCQHFSDVQPGFRVSPACFVPRPKVSSSMVSLRPRSTGMGAGCEAAFSAVIKAAFSHRRKTLANSLSRNAAFAGIAQTLLDKAGINGGRRAEELSVQEFEHLARIYYQDFSGE